MSTGTMGVSPVTVMTADNGGHSPEQIAELCVNRLLSVSDSAPPELAAQARAFREQMLDVILQYVKVAAAEDRKTVISHLERVGMSDLAQHIRSL
ncbi:hypothetical protein N9Q05_01525 [bacterium]|nr:hypothetical protein [bacterium]